MLFNMLREIIMNTNFREEQFSVSPVKGITSYPIVLRFFASEFSKCLVIL